MVATSAAVARLSQYLEALAAHVDDLSALAGEWETLHEDDRVSTSLHWDHLMADYLVELDEYYRAGQMMPEHQARYRDLLRKLKVASPVIRTLDLRSPTVSLEP